MTAQRAMQDMNPLLLGTGSPSVSITVFCNMKTMEPALPMLEAAFKLVCFGLHIVWCA